MDLKKGRQRSFGSSQMPDHPLAIFQHIFPAVAGSGAAVQALIDAAGNPAQPGEKAVGNVFRR